MKGGVDLIAAETRGRISRNLRLKLRGFGGPKLDDAPLKMRGILIKKFVVALSAL